MYANANVRMDFQFLIRRIIVVRKDKLQEQKDAHNSLLSELNAWAMPIGDSPGRMPIKWTRKR